MTDTFMRESDAFSWYMERDPVLRSTVVTVAWLDRAPDWDRFLAKVVQANRDLPMFRQRVIEPPARLATPRWSADVPFDVAWHVQRIQAPPPHTPQTVIDFAQKAAMTGFDRSRPLWEFTLIDGVDGGQAALVMKIHHSLTDGLGGMQLALTLFDTAPEPGATPTGGDGQSAPATERLGTADLVVQSVWHQIGKVGEFVQRRTAELPARAQTARHPLAGAQRAYATARSVARTVAPVSATLSPVMTGRGLDRSFASVECRLNGLLGAAHEAGGTLNDAFMAGVTGGLRRYHEHHGVSVGDLRVTMPISVRKPSDPPGGNRITLMRFVVPVAEPDPAARIRALHQLCARAREEPAVPLTNAIAGTLNLLPRTVVGSMLKNVDFVASDVNGFPFPVYLGGARLERWVAYGPTIGAALNTTLLSYNGTCSIGVNLDRAAVPDVDTMEGCLREGFGEVLDLAPVAALAG